MSERVCKGCGEPLAPNKARGRPRVWCSDRCRKRQYDLTCVECGGRADGSTPSGLLDPSEPVCIRCAPAHYAIWTREAIVLAVQEWADDHGGIPPSATEWLGAAEHRGAFPSVHTLQRVFGSWSAALRAAGFEPHPGGPVGGCTVLTPEQRAECARRYAAGESSTSIAADLGCRYMTVLHWARQAGVPIRSAGPRRKAAA